mmetsp:Transcript_126214/g.315526  ORF Transcript_126214/g.315526 Transcript_126214/m.315526 type:complete len:94 (+) Transcript_126214:467-748(+)
MTGDDMHHCSCEHGKYYERGVITCIPQVPCELPLSSMCMPLQTAVQTCYAIVRVHLLNCCAEGQTWDMCRTRLPSWLLRCPLSCERMPWTVGR